jgi:two-component system, NarL family, sensor histidine kinase UhpB
MTELASTFLSDSRPPTDSAAPNLTNPLKNPKEKGGFESGLPEQEVMYRALVEQIPAVVFIAYLDGGKSKAYVSPQIEEALGFTQEEWLDDPVLCYRQIHPDDKTRWSIEAAETIFSGKPLKSAYRVLARDGKVVWFRCEAKMVRRPDGRPWFILGVGFDITELKRTEQQLEERTESLKKLSTKLFQVQDQERRRIARDLHDGIGQYLVALKLNFEIFSSSQLADDSGLLKESERLLERCLSDIRNLSYLLHPPLLEDAGLPAAVKSYAEGFGKRSGISVNLCLPPDLARLPNAVELVLFRVLQESLTNVLRHSQSKTVEIEIERKEHEAKLRIKDFGRGIPIEVLRRFKQNGSHEGVGLMGMRERATELGGHLEISSDAQGTLVEVALPIHEISFSSDGKLS